MTDKGQRRDSLQDIIMETKNLLAFHDACRLEYPLTEEVQSFLKPKALHSNIQESKNAERDKIPSLTFSDLKNETASCTLCSLQQQRDDSLLLEGQEGKRPELFIIIDWEASQKDSDASVMSQETRELLTNMLAAIQLTWEDVVVSPIVKCPPEPDQEPSKEEVKKCLPYLMRQIEILKPKVICSMGTISSQSLLDTDRQLFTLRGKFRSLLNIPLMPTFHPALLLKHPDLKKASWQDLQLIRQKINSVS